jgi:hypothetical protein
MVNGSRLENGYIWLQVGSSSLNLLNCRITVSHKRQVTHLPAEEVLGYKGLSPIKLFTSRLNKYTEYDS